MSAEHTPEPEPKQIHAQPFTPPPPVGAEELASYIKMKESAGEQGFKADYKANSCIHWLNAFFSVEIYAFAPKIQIV